MAAGFLAVNLVTPKGVVAHTDADSVQAPGELGDFELLPGHVPMLSALKPGPLTIGKRATYAVSSGYLRVDQTGAVEILVEQAVAATDIDAAVAKTEAAAADAEVAKWGDKPQDGDYANLVARAAWAHARMDAANRAAH
jgi:F-type H+-transporting ATPase subunit epsilon